MPAFDGLKSTAPAWAAVEEIGPDESLSLRATPMRPGGVDGQRYDISVAIKKGVVKVSETKRGTILPAACPTRHINSDGTFCIGLDAGHGVRSKEDARRWWGWLEKFLVNQQLVAKYRRWPPGEALSHGEAALCQIEMERIGMEVGWEDEVSLAIEYGQGWLAGLLPRHRKHSGMLVNQRASCPRGCLRRGRPVLRRQCHRREVVSELVRLERERLYLEEKFIESYRKQNFECCGTMDECPFRVAA